MGIIVLGHLSFPRWSSIGDPIGFLVQILLIAALVDFGIALLNGERGIGAFVEPIVILLILVANGKTSWRNALPSALPATHQSPCATSPLSLSGRTHQHL